MTLQAQLGSRADGTGVIISNPVPKPHRLDPRARQISQNYLAVHLDPSVERIWRMAQLARPNGDHDRMTDKFAPKPPTKRHGARQAFCRERQPPCSPFDIRRQLVGFFHRLQAASPPREAKGRAPAIERHPTDQQLRLAKPHHRRGSPQLGSPKITLRQ